MFVPAADGSTQRPAKVAPVEGQLIHSFHVYSAVVVKYCVS